MRLTCPQCGFSREVGDDRLKSRSVIVTCPKCACRFRHAAAGFTEILPATPPPNATSGPEKPEEEEDIRVVATRAYQREANRFKDEDQQKSGGEANPWQEAPDQLGWFAAFSQTILRVMFSAPAFFKGLAPAAPLVRPLCFYLVLCVFQTLVERFWRHVFYALFSPTSMGDPQLEKILALLEPHANLALSLLLRTAIMVAELYIFSFLMSLAFRLVAPKRTTFPLIFQIMAYSSAPAILCVIPAIGSIVGLIWSLGCLAVGCKAALDTDWARVFFGFLPILLIFAPLLARSLGQL